MLIGPSPGELVLPGPGGTSVPCLAHALKTRKGLLLWYEYCCFCTLDRFRPSALQAAAAHRAEFKRSLSFAKMLGPRKESNLRSNINNVLCRLHLLILLSFVLPSLSEILRAVC